MSNTSIRTQANFYPVVKRLASDYKVNAYQISDLLEVALDKKQIKPVNHSFSKLLEVFYDSCESQLNQHMQEVGLGLAA